MLKILLLVIATVLALTGIVWLGQGIGLIHGSYMTGQPKWAVIGAALIAVAAGMFWFVRTRK
jgi:hypothetical protein